MPVTERKKWSACRTDSDPLGFPSFPQPEFLLNDMSVSRLFLIAVAVTSVWFCALAKADAIVVSRAMFADTIVEYYVEDEHVRVELEIGDALDEIRSARLFEEIADQLPFGFVDAVGFGQLV